MQRRFADLHMDVLAYSRALEAAARNQVLALGDEIQILLAGKDLSRLNRRQLRALLARLAAVIESGYGQIDIDTARGLEEMMAAIIPFLARTARSGRAAAPKIGDVFTGGLSAAEGWRSRSEALRLSITRAIRLSALSGQQDLALPLFGKGGVIERSARTAQSGAQELALAAETSVKKAVATESSLISGFRSSSMFDGKTCLRCGALDGELFDRNMIALNPAIRGEGAAPYHPHCRCTMIPELPDSGPASAVPGPDGKVSRGITFADWLGGKSKKYQARYFGPGRYELWQRGDITLTDLINGHGRALTLDELREKYSS